MGEFGDLISETSECGSLSLTIPGLKTFEYSSTEILLLRRFDGTIRFGRVLNIRGSRRS